MKKVREHGRKKDVKEQKPEPKKPKLVEERVERERIFAEPDDDEQKEDE